MENHNSFSLFDKWSSSSWIINFGATHTELMRCEQNSQHRSSAEIFHLLAPYIYGYSSFPSHNLQNRLHVVTKELIIGNLKFRETDAHPPESGGGIPQKLSAREAWRSFFSSFSHSLFFIRIPVPHQREACCSIKWC